MRQFVDWVHRLVLARKRAWLCTLLSLIGVIVATLARYAIDRGVSGFLFSGYFPVILVAATLCGWRIGLFAIAASVLAMQIAFWPPLWVWSGSFGPPAILLAFLTTIALVLAITELLRTLIFRYEAQARISETFNSELIHRNKNALQLLMTMIQRGLREEDLRPYFEALPARLEAWAAASELLRFGAAQSCDIADLVTRALASFDRDRFDVDGPHALIGERAATQLAMGLHELGTNAAKYGALHGPAGMVRLRWNWADNAIALQWEESGGPPVVPPVRRGFGSMILRPHGDLTVVEIQYLPSGLVAHIVVKTKGR